MLTETLSKYGIIGVEALKQDVQKISATGKTERSIHFKVIQKEQVTELIIYGRKFFRTLESGRGPRKTSKDSGFKDYMLEYMKAKGIGSDLPTKKREQLAKFLVWKINKEGDKTFKKGGRIVYSPTLTKLVFEIKVAVKDDIRKAYTKTLVNGFKHT